MRSRIITPAILLILGFLQGCVQPPTLEVQAEEEAIREKRAKERDALSAKHKAVAGEVSMTPAPEQISKLDKMLSQLNRIHKRVA